jgi:alpha-1,3-rhamnosyl/mannosyltransferase
MPMRCAVTVHDAILFVMQRVYERRKRLRYRIARALERAVARRAALVLTDSAASGDDIVRWLGVDRSRVRVAPLGVDRRFAPRPAAEVDAVRARLGLRRPYLLYLGGIDERKNVPRLLEAYAGLRAQRASTPDLVLAGPIEREAGFAELVARVSALGLDDAVRRVGYVDDAGLPALLSGAECFVFPSLYEGFGLPPLEAMACGTPVVATNGGSLGEVLGDAALTVPPDDAAALGRAMARVLDDAALREDLRRRGRERAAGFTWEATARATRAAWEQAIR